MADNADVEGYRSCVLHEVRRESYISYMGRQTDSFTIYSGSNPSLTIIEDLDIVHGDTEYLRLAESGADAEYFHTVIVDDDNSPAKYRTESRPRRPLPKSSYVVSFRYQFPTDFPCNYFPDDFALATVSVTAPAGTLHEAFFDPVSAGTAVKADGSNGVLKPTSFTVNGTSTEITSLEWSSNQVVLTLGTHVSLSGQVMDFIALTGNVILSLFADDATANSTAGTYTWSMTTQPWADGDKLMLRIRPVGTEIFLQDLPSSLEQGASHWVHGETGEPELLQELQLPEMRPPGQPATPKIRL